MDAFLRSWVDWKIATPTRLLPFFITSILHFLRDFEVEGVEEVPRLHVFEPGVGAQEAVHDRERWVQEVAENSINVEKYPGPNTH